MLAIEYKNQKEYERQRQKLYLPIRDEGIFDWDMYSDGEYALASVYSIPKSFREEIAFATEQLGNIYQKTTEVVQLCTNELLQELGIPYHTWEAVRLHIPYSPVTAIGRFDFARTSEGLKVLEFNSDTPTSLVEAFYTNGKVCSYYHLTNPNEGEDRKITKAFQDLVTVYQQEGYPTENIAFSALLWHKEDAGTTRYLLKQSHLPGKFIPIHSLALHPEEDGLYAFDEQTKSYFRVDLWYRLHALEHLANDKTSNNYPFGEKVLDTIAKRKLAIINPPSAFLAQSKAMQALIWNLQEQGEFFTPEEQEIIRTYMLPTYLENVFQDSKTPYVQKPFFGREGGGITIYDQDNQMIAKDKGNLYWNQQMVYQKKVELETTRVSTLKGEYEGYLLWGSFLINGQASALVTRIGETITNDDSYYLPICLR